MTVNATRRVLIVCPQFPPVSAPDMQRVRMSLPHFEEFGWHPYVVAVEPGEGDTTDPLLLETLPESSEVERVKAISATVARCAGIGNVALRALPFLYSAGSRAIKRERVDLAYFSTTMFLSMPLGRVWKAEFGTPYVLDMQDPWLSDYYETHPGAAAPPKYRLARQVHAVLEPWTMKRVDGLVSVSEQYLQTLCRRYPRLGTVPSVTIPFGASSRDFELLASRPQANRHFTPRDGRIHGVYAGRAGDDLATGLEIVFAALRRGLAADHDLFSRVDVHFVGTDYAPDGRARMTVAPVAARCGVEGQVFEDTKRAPYFEALQLLKDADFLLAVGSDDPSYTPSKIYPYILARKPLLAVMHEQSPVVDVLRETGAAHVVAFPSNAGAADKTAAAERLASYWRAILQQRQPAPTDWSRFERYTAREMTRRQCALFDDVIRRSARMAA